MAGLHEIMENKGACPCLVSADETLANELNSFYAHFEASNANAGHANSGLTNADRSSSSEAAINPRFFWARHKKGDEKGERQKGVRPG